MTHSLLNNTSQNRNQSFPQLHKIMGLLFYFFCSCFAVQSLDQTELSGWWVFLCVAVEINSAANEEVLICLEEWSVGYGWEMLKSLGEDEKARYF